MSRRHLPGQAGGAPRGETAWALDISRWGSLKRLAPSVSLALLMAAGFFMDFVFGVLVLAGHVMDRHRAAR